MKLSELAEIYDQVSRAGNDSKRVKLLADAFKLMDEKTLRAAAHFSMSELVQPELSDRLGIGPGIIREQLARLAKKEPSQIEEEIRETGDISLVAAACADGKDSLDVDELWTLVNDTVQ